MRTVYESLQSYLGFLGDERKSKEGNESRRYGLHILKRSLSSKDGLSKGRQPNCDDDQRQQPLAKRISSSRVHSVVSGLHAEELGKRALNVGKTSGSNLVSTEGILDSPAMRRGQRSSQYREGLTTEAPAHGEGYARETVRSHWKSRVMEKWNLKVKGGKANNSGDTNIAELPRAATKERRVREDCLNEASENVGHCHGAGMVQSVRNSLEDSFDASTIQYYSAGKRSAQGGRCARDQPAAGTRMSQAVQQSLSPRIGGHERHHVCARTNYAPHEFANGSMIIGKAGVFEKLFSMEDDSSAGEAVEAESIETQGGDNIADPVSMAASNDQSGESWCVREVSHAEAGREEGEQDVVKMEAKVRFSDLQEEEEKGEDEGFVSYRTTLSPSSSRNGRRKFPPPLISLAMHGHSSQSPSSSVTGVCLRSMRKDGRFMLQEVKAPPQKFFRAVRKDGRLRLELLDPVDDVQLETSLPGEPRFDKAMKEEDGSSVMEQESGREAGCVTKRFLLEQQSNCAMGSRTEMAEKAGGGSSVDIVIPDEEAAVAMNSMTLAGKDTSVPGGGFSCAEIREHRQSDRRSWIRSTDWVPAF